ncbi:MAG: hypothetical protein ACRDSZ_25270 [Pseudonocardiaceae bacterium]
MGGPDMAGGEDVAGGEPAAQDMGDPGVNDPGMTDFGDDFGI